MKILLLHLSDSHIKTKGDIHQGRTTKLIDSLNPLKGFEECFIIFSGDIVKSGNENEYKLAGQFLGSLVKGIKERFSFHKFVRILVVPGNHDIDFTSVERSREDITKLYPNNLDSNISSEIGLLKAFSSFSKFNKCFMMDNILDQKLFQFNNFKISFNLINTAIFSTLKDDKGIHYLPQNQIAKLYSKSNADLAITVMHHSPEWFAEKTKIELEKALYESTSILFLGHEHNPSSKYSTLNSTDDLNIIGGGIFGGDKLQERSEFNAVIVDSVKGEMEVYGFSWESKGNIYAHKKLHQNAISYKRSLFKVLLPADEFIKILKKDT